MFFDFGRKEGYPTQYSANQTPVTVDVLEVGIITSFLILYVCLLLIVPGKDLKRSCSKFLRITVSLLIGLLILLANFGQEWEVGHVVSQTAYKAGSPHEINASMGIKIGLRSVNVTLKSVGKNHESLKQEMIDYNERFSWEWDQGRFGFGPYAGRIQREFRAAQRTGLPLPIIWIVDYFVIDGEGYRYGRFYRTAGWYAHIAIWTAFACWIVANILFRAVIQYGAIFLGITGCLLITGNILWLAVRNPLPLAIPFDSGVIRTSYGISFWMSLINGILCISIALVIYLMDLYFDKKLYSFFGVDSLASCYEESYGGEEPFEPMTVSDDVELRNMPGTSTFQDQEEIYENIRPVYIKRSMTLKSRRSQKPRRRISTEEIYQNV